MGNNMARLVITSYDAKGNITKQTKGPWQWQLWLAHKFAKCSCMCGYCYDEACKQLDKKEKQNG